MIDIISSQLENRFAGMKDVLDGYLVLPYLMESMIVIGVALGRAVYTNKAGRSFDVWPPGLCCLASCC